MWLISNKRDRESHTKMILPTSKKKEIERGRYWRERKSYIRDSQIDREKKERQTEKERYRRKSDT